MPKLRRSTSGLTLTELIVVVTILSTLTGLVYAVIRFESQTYTRQTAQNVTQNDLRIWLARIAQNIRRSGYDPTGVNETTDDPPTFGLQTNLSASIAATELKTTADIDGDGIVDAGASENLGFRLNTAESRLEIWQGGSSWRPVLDGVTSLSIEYLDADGAATTVRRDVRTIRITISAEAETGGYPGSPPPLVTQTATVELRNRLRRS